MRLLAECIGWLYIAAAFVGWLDLADFHVYFGRDAAAWHAKHAKKDTP